MSTTENKLIPRLRFPEFENDGDWDLLKLGEVGEFIGGGTPDTTNEDFWNGDILWFTPTEVKEGKLNDCKRKITELGLRNSSAKFLKLLSIEKPCMTMMLSIGEQLKPWLTEHY